jgi:hypothetical protein
MWPNTFLTIAQIFLIIFSSSLFSALNVLILYKFLTYFTRNNKTIQLITLIYGLGTLTLIYSTVFYSHALQAFLLFFSFVLIIKSIHQKNDNNKLLIFSGILVGISVTVSLTSVVAILFLFFILIKTRKIEPLLLFTLGCFIGSLPWFIYNYTIFGNPLDFSYKHMDPIIWPHLVGKFGTKIPNPFIILRLLIGPYRGLLIYSPVIIFSFIGLWFMYKKYKWESLLIISLFLSFLLINSSWWAWEGGTSFGPRHLLPTIPFLMIPLVFSLEKIRFEIIKPFIIVSIFFMIIGLGPWEWIGKPYTVKLPKEIELKATTTLEPLANPLKDYYFKNFIKNGPRARLIESLIEGRLNIRQEFMVLKNNPLPFITILPLILLIALIWYREINLKEMIKLLKRNLDIFFFLAIIIILFF